MTTESYFKEWKFLHALHAKVLKEGNHPARVRIEKRIKELKPMYAEFSQQAASRSDQAPTTAEQTSKTVEHDAEHSGASADHMAFSFYTVSSSQRATVLCDCVYERWLRSRSFKRTLSATSQQDYYRIVETIVANLLYCEATGHDGVRFSRDKKIYATSSRYRPTAFNERFLTVVDDLAAIGVVKQVKGDKWKAHHVTKLFGDTQTVKTYGLKQSFMALGKNLNVPFKPTTADVNFINEGREVIILKKGEGSQLLDYKDEDFPEAEKCRKQVKIINDMLHNTGDLLTLEGQAHHDQRKRHLVRRFTHSCTESGGRLWEGFWLSGMKREERPVMLRLNGEPTVELDFSSMVVRLAYIIAEKPAPTGDQYSIPGLDSESRDGIKRVMATLLFDSSRNRDRFPKDVAKLFTGKDQKKGWSHVYKAIRSHHYELRAYLDRGLGHYIQFLESQVMVNILVRCAMKGMVALPIHDALVVPQSQAYRVQGIMGQTVRYMFGREASIPVMVKIAEQVQKSAA